jgi:hypothetical protein
MTKRSRGDDDVSQLVVKPDAVCEVVLREARRWRDRCNSLYDIESKMYVTKDQIVLKVGFFDELHCAQILALSEVALPGNYTIQSVSCDMKKQLVSFAITKSSCKRSKPAEASLMSLLHDPTLDSEMLRLRTVFDVKDTDAQTVVEALRAVTLGFDRTEEWHRARCAHRPGMYVLYLCLTGAVVPDECVRSAATHKGVVDFENKQIIISVDKSQSDIY